MNKIFVVSLSFMMFSALVLNPVFADSDIEKTVCKVPLSAASMATGTVVGTPIGIIRKTGSQYVGCVKEFKKDSNTYKFWGALYSAPVAAVAGPIKGTICGAKNAIHYSVAKPFSREAFSLGNIEGNVPTKAGAKTNLQPNKDKPELQPWGSPR
jgi:hypothetical protein